MNYRQKYEQEREEPDPLLEDILAAEGMPDLDADVAKSEAIFEQLRLFKVNKTKLMIIKEIVKML